MPPLHNPRWERFCIALFEGEPASAAYEKAGYRFNEGNAIRLKGNEKVQARLAELQLEAQKNSEVTVASLLGELEEARVKATSLNQLSASVRATAEKARISGLLIERHEVGAPGDFENIDNLPDLMADVRERLGDDGAELVAAVCGIDENGHELVKQGSRASFRRKLDRYRWRRVDERLLMDAVGRDIEVEITGEDVAQLREIMQQFDELTDGIRARSARPVNTVYPAELEHRKLIAERKRVFGGGNGSRR